MEKNILNNPNLNSNANCGVPIRGFGGKVAAEEKIVGLELYNPAKNHPKTDQDHERYNSYKNEFMSRQQLAQIDEHTFE